MTVYHVSDPQTPYTLAQLFSQVPPHSQPPLPNSPTPFSSPTATTPFSSSSSQTLQQQRWQQHPDFAPQAKASAEQLRQQLLEAGKHAVYQLLKKSVYDALPGMLVRAREDRAAEAAREAAEAERLREEVRQAAAREAAEAARLKAEAKARARAEAM